MTGGDWHAAAVWSALVFGGITVGGAMAADHPEFLINAAPFYGHWSVEFGPGLALSVLTAAVLVVAAPVAARLLAWRRLLVAAATAAFVWSVALALSVGSYGLTKPLTTPEEYLHGVRYVHNPGEFLRSFTTVLPSYPTHIKGHPPGLVLLLWLLDQVGLGSPVWASVLVVAVGASAVPAVLLTLRHVAGEDAARRAAPFLVITPAAVWLATSGDALFTGVVAWAVAITVVATQRTGRGWPLVAGAAWAGALLLSYGLVLVAPVATAVAWHRRRLYALLPIAATTVVLLGLLGAATGFWWPAGLAATHRAYLAGVASRRPASVFLWLNVVAVAGAAGPAIAPALRRARGPVILLAAGAVAGLALADLSLLSKAEIERIWLPWIPWLLTATAVLPAVHRRAWLTAQAATGLALQIALRSHW